MSEQERREELATLLRALARTFDRDPNKRRTTSGESVSGAVLREIADLLPRPNVPELTQEEWETILYGEPRPGVWPDPSPRLNAKLRRILEQREGEDE